jgi:hypothetical protein
MKRPVPDQAINKLTIGNYSVWTGMPIRKRPVWLGSPKTPEEERKEKEFEDKVMEITDSIWDHLERIDHVTRKAHLKEMSLQKSESWHKALGYSGAERHPSEKGWKKKQPKTQGPVKEKVKRQRFNLPPKLTPTSTSSTRKMGSSW